MTRTWANHKESDGWVMVCDRADCNTKVGPRPTTKHLPLDEFVRLGWFIARTFGDRCPACVEAGRVDRRVTAHSLMQIGDGK